MIATFNGIFQLNKLSSSRVLMLILTFALLLPSVLLVHAAPIYTAGVHVGDWASYAPLNVTYRSTGAFFPEPQYLKDLNETVVATATVTQISSSLTNVTVRSVEQFKNGTIVTLIDNGDLMTGAGNLTYALIAGGLSYGEQIWMKPSAPTINETVQMTYLGVSRTVNIFNMTESTTLGYGSYKISIAFVWDQQSGMVLEAKSLTVFSSPSVGDYVEYLDFKITATNIFSATAPDFQISVSPTSFSVDAGNSATATATLTSVNGFTGPINLAAYTGASASLNPASVTLTSGGTLTSVLTFSTTTTTSPGTYVVTITGTGPSIHHDALLTVTVTAPSTAPSFTISASHPSSVTSGSSVTSTITIGSVNGFSGTVTLTDTVPSGLTCNAITPNTIMNSGTASLSCHSNTPGTYTITITATSSSTSHTTTTTVTITAAPSQTSSAPATILGLDPAIFYTIIGIVVVIVAAAAYLGLRSRSQEPEIPSQPTTAV